jgi:non-homologous end joining protein Ku
MQPTSRCSVAVAYSCVESVARIERTRRAFARPVGSVRTVALARNGDIENVALESTRTIEIDEFVDRSEIDPRSLLRPYYLRPDGKVGHDAFAVIRETIREKNKVAIGRVVLTNPSTSSRSSPWTRA